MLILDSNILSCIRGGGKSIENESLLRVTQIKKTEIKTSIYIYIKLKKRQKLLMKKNCDADIGHDMWGRTICLHVTINIRIYHVQAHEE
jgi:hypothetical protein